MQMPSDAMPTEGQFQELQAKGKRLFLGTLAARSGTRWLCDIVENHDRTYAVTERDTTAEAFWRYVKYNELPIDTDGIVKLLKQRIAADWLENDTTLIFSPYFSHGFLELYRDLSPDKIIFGFAKPEFVVQSIFNKGVFEEDYSRRNTDLALGYQPEFANQWSHLFGRIVPRGESYQAWQGLTRVGKIAWWVNRINIDIYKQLQDLPDERIVMFDLSQADQNYEYYLDLARLLDLSPLMSEERFLSLKKLTVKKSDNVKHAWSETERAEFDSHIEEWQNVYDGLAPRTTLGGSDAKSTSL
jgi:hypothetical protein